MLVILGEEALSNFGFDILAVRRIKPGDVSWPILAVFKFWGSISVGQIVIVAALVEGILVGIFSFFKGFHST